MRDWKENGEKADGDDQEEGLDMGKICVIHTEKHDLVIAHCYVDYNNVLNMVKNFHEENLPGHFLYMFK